MQQQLDPEEESKGETVWGSDFGLICSGLFNFYQFAAFEVKEIFIGLMEEYLLKFESELHICLPGFIMCILPGIDDQNEGMSKKVERVLRKTERIVGTRLFFATLWQTILRSSRTRMGGLKFLQRNTLPRNLDHAKETEIFVI